MNTTNVGFTLKTVTFEVWHKKDDEVTVEDLLENMPDNLNFTHDRVAIIATRIKQDNALPMVEDDQPTLANIKDTDDKIVDLAIERVLENIRSPDYLWQLDNCKPKDRASKAGDLLVLMDDFHGVGVRIYVILENGVILYK